MKVTFESKFEVGDQVKAAKGSETKWRGTVRSVRWSTSRGGFTYMVDNGNPNDLYQKIGPFREAEMQAAK